jgi:hypothetical protein
MIQSEAAPFPPPSLLSIPCSCLSPVTESAQSRRPRPGYILNGAFPLSLASRHASPSRAAIPHIVLAAVLALALLSGIVPFNALSSSHECGMSCCLSKSPHSSGSCSVAFASDEGAETTDAGHEHAAQNDHAKHASQTVASHAGHESAKQSSGQRSKTAEATSQRRSVRAQVLTKPCAPECAAAASNASRQTRRPRDPAAQTIAGKLRPEILTVNANDFSNSPSSCAERHRLLPPRAPPLLLFNLSS